jgi:hypothetical protein
MIHHFDSRFATYEGATQAQMNKGTLPRLTTEQHNDPAFLSMPHYWVAEVKVIERLAKRGWDKGWLVGWRNIARSSDERTMICGMLPLAAVGHSFPLILSNSQWPECLCANLTSFVLDYVARQKIAGSNLTYGYVTQWPVFTPQDYEKCPPWEREGSLYLWIGARVLELIYTAYDMTQFAVDTGYKGPPFRWNKERRFRMRAELDAAFFHLYGIERDDVDYIMDSFRAFQNNDRARFDRTKGLILEIYDAMAEASRTGKPYQTILDPPPGEGPRHG